MLTHVKRPGRGRVLALILAILVLAPVLAAPAGIAALVPGVDVEGVHHAPWSAWRVETISNEVWSHLKRPIAFDSSGNVHVGGMYDDGRPGYFVREHGVWARTRLNDSVGSVSGLAIDDAGGVHLLYFAFDVIGPEWDFYTNTIYAYFDGVTWHEEVLAAYDRPTFTDTYNLELDSQGRVHVLFENPAQQAVHGVRDASGWSFDVIPLPHAVFLAEFALDSQDRVHVMYNSPGDGIFYVMRDADGSWGSTRLSMCYFGASIAVDSADEPHVACNTRINGVFRGLAHVTRDASGAWQYEIVDDHGDDFFPHDPYLVGDTPSIAIDSRDRVHISYGISPYVLGNDITDVTHPGQLYYAAQVNTEWVRERVDPDGWWVGETSSIALDEMDRPHIVYLLGKRFRSSCASTANVCADTRYVSPVISELSPFGI